MIIPRKFIKFALSGGIVVALNIAFLYAFVTWFGIWYLPASILAFVLSVLAHFTLQKLWVFIDTGTGRTHVQFLKFSALALVNLLINSVCLYVLVSLLGWNYLLAQAALRIILACVNYVSYDAFVFTASK